MEIRTPLSRFGNQAGWRSAHIGMVATEHGGTMTPAGSYAGVVWSMALYGAPVKASNIARS